MFRVVLVEPHYGGNIGSVARLMMNFEQRELYIVNPLADPLGEEALRWAVNAKRILERARIVRTLEEAVKDCAVAVGTTDEPGPKMVRRTPMTPREFAENFASYWHSDECVAIVFGREPSGLTNEELDYLDFAVTIPTSRQYTAMNLSHAVAVILYELYLQRAKPFEMEPPKQETLRMADEMFKKLVEWVGRRNPRETMNAWSATIRRGAKTEKEASAIVGVLSEVIKRCLRDTRNSEGV